ncbi:MAG: hypothetical protein AMJ70_07460 [Dehalococcoidia bacterium SG8_51_3]|nr:MAG: hypothetical protein AMJ70_07460 [Dehalococcoidia bacterium SG8_51_3]
MRLVRQRESTLVRTRFKDVPGCRERHFVLGYCRPVYGIPSHTYSLSIDAGRPALWQNKLRVSPNILAEIASAVACLTKLRGEY